MLDEAVRKLLVAIQAAEKCMGTPNYELWDRRVHLSVLQKLGSADYPIFLKITTYCEHSGDWLENECYKIFRDRTVQLSVALAKKKARCDAHSAKLTLGEQTKLAARIFEIAKTLMQMLSNPKSRYPKIRLTLN